MEPLAGDILIVGLGASGEAAAEYCSRRLRAGDAITVTVVDAADDEGLRARADRLRGTGIRVELGVETVDRDYDLAVLSPGVAPHAPLFLAAASRASEVVSEIEFAYRRSVSPWIAVTGTNGKTTVTSLIGHLLTVARREVAVVGNIGHPAIEAVDGVGSDGILVAEVSSFQLALADRFRPKVSVLLNITPDHLDWHRTMDRYIADKSRVFARQGPGDVAVIDADDRGSSAFIEPVREQGVTMCAVSVSERFEGGAWLASDGTLVAGLPAGDTALIHRDELAIRGDHNVANALAAAAAVLAVGVDPELVRNGLRSFEPLEHRLEPAGVIAGVEYFNDSKATNPDAVVKALTAFEGRPLVLLLGGRNKGNRFDELARAIDPVRVQVVVFGEAAEEILRDLDPVGVRNVRARGLDEAFAVAGEIAAALRDAVVLLSPGCASFDEFASYIARGERFKQLVAELSASEGVG